MKKCSLSQFELDLVLDLTSTWSPFWHFFEDLDHFPKLFVNSPNIITRRFHEPITMFYELFLRDSNIFQTWPTTSEDVPNNYIN